MLLRGSMGLPAAKELPTRELLKQPAFAVAARKPKEIANIIKGTSNAEVIPSQIILKDNLNKIGNYKVEINFHSEVKANIFIKIEKIKAK